MTKPHDDEPTLLDHEYDGIREFDNQLPEWWLAIFFGTIIFAFIYWVHYQIAGGPSSKQELATAMAKIQAQKPAGPQFTEDKLAALFTGDAVGKGREVFTGKCAACHGPEGGGLIGPNLTDKFWLHGQGSRLDIAKVIAVGVPDKGMPAWGETLPEDEVVAAAAFVYSIKNANVAGGKPPQGQEAP